MALVSNKKFAWFAVTALTLTSAALISTGPAQAQSQNGYVVEVDGDDFSEPNVERGIVDDHGQKDFRRGRSREVTEFGDQDVSRVRGTVVERRIIEERVIRPVVEQRIIERRVQPVVERRVVVERPIVRRVVVQRPVVRQVVIERPVVHRHVERRFEPLRQRNVVQRRFIEPVY